MFDSGIVWEYNNIVNLFQGEAKFLTGGKEHYATSPRAFMVESVRFRYRRYSPDERTQIGIFSYNV